MKKIYTAFFLFTLCIAKTNYINAQVNVQDSLALVDLYNSTNGAHWFRNHNWLSAKPVSRWYGIILKNKQVAQILLYNNNLSGVLPSSLGNLQNLTGLYLDGNYLTGSIPASFGNLYKAIDMSLDHNLLSGSIPTGLGNLLHLGYLSLSDNQLSGSIPSSLGNLTHLGWFYLQNNQLSGSIPSSIGNLTHLNYLSFSNNQLSGSIPPEFGKLIHLYILYLNYNQLSGSIPAELGKLRMLYNLYLNNNQLDGNIPPELGNLNVTNLYLNNNELSGTMPTAFGRLGSLVNFSVAHNKLEGVIPASFANLTNLGKLTVADNLLRGALPSFLNGLQRLNRLNIVHNNFTFDGMETLVQQHSYSLIYSNERKINIHQNGNVLSVNAGGALSNNTYKWFNHAALVATLHGDSTFTPSSNGDYSVSVTNSICIELTLYSDTVSINIADKNFYSNNGVENKLSASFSVSPNPAQNILYLHINADATANAVINIYDLNRKKLITQTTLLQKQNSISINIASLAAGNYFIEVIADDKVFKQKFVKN